MRRCSTSGRWPNLRLVSAAVERFRFLTGVEALGWVILFGLGLGLILGAIAVYLGEKQ